MEAFWDDIGKRLGTEYPDAMPLHFVLTLDNVESPQEGVWNIGRWGGEPILKLPFARADAGEIDGLVFSRDRCSDDALFRHLVRAGVWAFQDPNLEDHHRWLRLARVAALPLRFRRRRFLPQERGAGPHFTFGAQSDTEHFALPCADLHWDGRSWTGVVARDTWKGDGGAVMDAFWEIVGQRFGEEGAPKETLHCLLTADKQEDPQEVIWEIIRSGGGVVCRMPLRREHAGVGEIAGSPCMAPEVAARFMRLSEAGSWSLQDRRVDSMRWTRLARAANLQLSFKLRRLRRDSKSMSRLLTFGAQADPANYAIPCADLHWEGGSWVGDATASTWRGNGEEVMGAFWESIEPNPGDVGADDLPLQCVFEVDDDADPQQVVWKILRVDGDVVVQMTLRRHGLRAAGQM